MKIWIKLAGITCLVAMSSSCIKTYSYRDRIIEVTDRSGKPAAGMEISYSHALPAIYLPRSPEPVTEELDHEGRAAMRLPTVLGWLEVKDSIEQIEEGMIRKGGSLWLVERPAFTEGDWQTFTDSLRSAEPVPTWKVLVQKEEK